MKVAVTANGNNPDAQIDPRFGRCAFFIIVETDDMQFEACRNDQAAMVGGAGIQSAQFLASHGVRAVITGRCGPNAVSALSAAGIDLFLDQTGSVGEAIERFKNQTLPSSAAANVEPHHGLEQIPFGEGSPNPPMGRGMGQGRGMGGGRGGKCRRK